MANLRITRIALLNNRIIRAEFSEDISLSLLPENVTVTPLTVGIPAPTTLNLKINKRLLDIETQPLTPRALYSVVFQSTDASPFTSRDGTAFLFEDGKDNEKTVVGPEEPSDDIKTNLISYLAENVYNLDFNTIARNTIDAQSKLLSDGQHDIGQAASDNYLEILISDERKRRGAGPYDRLNEEGAFKVLRVGLNETDTPLLKTISFDTFPSFPITLLRQDVTSEKLEIGSGPGSFDDLLLSVNNKPVTKLIRVLIQYQSGGSAEYPISTLGYRIKNSKYDPNVASTLFTLEDNEFRLSENLADQGIKRPAAGDIIFVSYEYKSFGRIIDFDSIVVSEQVAINREVAPPIITQFSTENAPIVDSNDLIPELGGIDFLDPFANPPFSAAHPAFRKEIPFRLESLPSAAGEYSIEYETGRVFVYGAIENDGTGEFPPCLSYTYRKSFDNRLDYSVNPDDFDLAALTGRELRGKEAKVSFNYEQVLVPNVDYVSDVHSETIDERVENRLRTLSSVAVKNTPITNAFRVYNETSGELYTIRRFTDTTIEFTFTTPPNIEEVIAERVEFVSINNETLLINEELTNAKSTRILQLVLTNDNIISNTEDAIGSSFNSSVTFSRNDIFENELYFDNQVISLSSNLDRLEVGQYMIDYTLGVIYLGVKASQLDDVGTVNYKAPRLQTKNPHIISISEVYHSIDLIQGISKTLDYNSFDDTEVVPSSFDRTDERFLNGDETLPYIFNAGDILVSDNVKTVRGIFDAFDLTNNIEPINFAEGAEINGNIITVDSTGIALSVVSTVTGGKVSVPFISNGIEIVSVSNVLKISDNEDLWSTPGTFSDYEITLLGTVADGTQVRVDYNLGLNGAATPIVDYDRGEYFIDYTYLADEILISYEYGDNVIDFRQSNSIDEGKEYFVTYTIGALRDSLLANFGTLVDIPEIQSFDTSVPREPYRDALQGALQSFPKGPTLEALKLIVSSITKIDPEILESIFDFWILGISSLFRNCVDYTESIDLAVGKFDHGALVNNVGESITFPISSNLRLRDGTLEFWAIPEWDGLDNDATLTFSNLKIDGYQIPSSNVFIGASSFNPTYDLNNEFSLNRIDNPSPIGVPNAIYSNTAGLFIYYDDVIKRWYLFAKAKPLEDGYIFSGVINTTGEIYDVKQIDNIGDPSDVIRSFTNKVEFSLNLDGYDVSNPDGYVDGYDGYVPGYSFDAFTWMSDDKHYFFDFAEEKAKNRFSIFKDGRGYLNFEVFDNGAKPYGRRRYHVNSDISGWKAGEKHHIAVSWRLDSFDRRDEMHLYIDGEEVPNILKYGGRPKAASTDRFRTVKPEFVVGTVPKNTISGDDITTVAGTNVLTSDSINFQAKGIVSGDTIEILEVGFGTYNITSVVGNELYIDSTIASSLTDVKFSVNKFSAVVSSQIDLFSNIAVSIFDGTTEVEIPGQRSQLPSYRIEKNAALENILTILGNADAGDQVLIRTLGLNFRKCKAKLYLWDGYQHILKTQIPPPINLDEVRIIPCLQKLTTVGPLNSSVVGGKFVASGFSPTLPSNATEGRRLSIRITGGNVNFSDPVTVKLTGFSSGGLNETLTFTKSETQTTLYKWEQINDVEVIVKPFSVLRDSISFEIKEAFSITKADGNASYPIVRYSFQSTSGDSLTSDGVCVFGDNVTFKDSDVGNFLVITSPIAVAGNYEITEKVASNMILTTPVVPISTDIEYKIFNTTIGRSGFQNGFLTLETASQVGVPYKLPKGHYLIEYDTWLNVNMDNVQNLTGHIGSDFENNNQAKAIIDEFRILSKQISDVRVGETLALNEKSVTTDYNALREFEPDSDTLFYLNFNEKPFTNLAPFYKISNKDFIQSERSVNSEFGQSLVLSERGLKINNTGRLSTKSEGTIEFWVSPRIETQNDPFIRYYFDAASAFEEEVTSISTNTIKTISRIKEILSIRLATDINNTGVDYSDGATIQSDGQTVQLALSLPSQQTPVKITYIQTGRSGDRLSIFKDEFGFVVFRVKASNKYFEVRQPVFWQRDTWHRIQCIYKFNRKDNRDELRMFIDGEETHLLLFGSGFLFGQGHVFGQDNPTARLIADINFKDLINEFYIGSAFDKTKISEARIDNLKISNTARIPVLVGGVAKDVYFQENRETVKPTKEDLFTTYLVDFDTLITENEDYAILRDPRFGIFSFIINVFDSFGIVSNSAKIEQILRALILALKPAQSKVTINIIE